MPTSFLRKAWNSHAANAADSLAAARPGAPATPATALAADPAGPIGHIDRMTKVRWAPTMLSTSIIEPATQVIEVWISSLESHFIIRSLRWLPVTRAR